MHINIYRIDIRNWYDDAAHPALHPPSFSPLYILDSSLFLLHLGHSLNLICLLPFVSSTILFALSLPYCPSLHYPLSHSPFVPLCLTIHVYHLLPLAPFLSLFPLSSFSHPPYPNFFSLRSNFLLSPSYNLPSLYLRPSLDIALPPAYDLHISIPQYSLSLRFISNLKVQSLVWIFVFTQFHIICIWGSPAPSLNKIDYQQFTSNLHINIK